MVFIMKSQNQIQHLVYAFITVIITVHAFVFYSLYVVEGDDIMRATGTTSVLPDKSVYGADNSEEQDKFIWNKISSRSEGWRYNNSC